MRRLWRALLPVVILAVAAAGVAVLVLTRPEEPGVPPEEPEWPVAAETVEPGLHQPRLTLYGHVETPRVTTLTAAVEADVQAVPVQDGQRVAAGERLVELDRSDLESTLQAREAELAELEAALVEERLAVASAARELEAEEQRLELARRRVNRLERLRADDGASEAEVDEAREALEQQRLAVIGRQQAVDAGEARIDAAEARRDRARAERDLARRNLARARVEAPFEGRINAVEVSPGERVSPGGPLVTLYDTAALEVRAHLPASRLGAVRRALATGAVLDARARVDGREHDASLTRLAGESGRDEGGQAGLFALEGRHDDVPLNRFAEVVLRLPPEPQTVVVPYEALYGRDRIYRIEGGQLEELRAHRLGEADRPDGRRGALLRVPGLEAGDRILTTQVPRAVDGLRVRVQEEADP